MFCNFTTQGKKWLVALRSTHIVYWLRYNRSAYNFKTSEYGQKKDHIASHITTRKRNKNNDKGKHTNTFTKPLSSMGNRKRVRKKKTYTIPIYFIKCWSKYFFKEISNGYTQVTLNYNIWKTAFCLNRGVSQYRILPISRDIGWPVQQLDYFRFKATYTDCRSHFIELLYAG